MNTWIFQGNPTVFNIDKYLEEREQIWWSLNQKHFLKQVKVGDIVFLWRSDGNEKASGGILAKAEIIGKPEERTDVDAKEYWFKDGWSKKGLGIPLRVLEVKFNKGFIKRTDLIKHPILKDLQIISGVRNQTNYLISKEESQEIDKLWNGNMLNLYPEDSINLFLPPNESEKLVKTVGTSQHTDGVRIDKEFHDIFNPPKSRFYVERGKARNIKVLFNNKVFDAEYRFENQEDKTRILQSIRFRKRLKQEFKKVFPQAEGEFTIERGFDLNHFVFSFSADSIISAEDDESEYPEGKIAYRTHRVRERNREVIDKAKKRFMKNNGGRLFCEVCGFDFQKTYGKRGEDFIEGHHSKLVSEMQEGEKTKVDDIRMLCSNCHRMVHRKPILTVEQMGKLINK